MHFYIVIDIPIVHVANAAGQYSLRIKSITNYTVCVWLTTTSCGHFSLVMLEEEHAVQSHGTVISRTV